MVFARLYTSDVTEKVGNMSTHYSFNSFDCYGRDKPVFDRRDNRFESIDKHNIYRTFNAYKNRGARHVHQHDSSHGGSRNLPDIGWPNERKMCNISTR